MKCEYGCGNEAVYILKGGKNCCTKYATQCPANKNKNSEGVKKAHQDGRCFGWKVNRTQWWEIKPQNEIDFFVINTVLKCQ